MAQTKTNSSSLDAREAALEKKLKKIRARRREIERAERAARGERIVGLAVKFGVLGLPDTLFAATFKKLAAENPPAPDSTESANTDEDASAARTQPAENSTPAPVETAQPGGGLRKLFGGGA